MKLDDISVRGSEEETDGIDVAKHPFIADWLAITSSTRQWLSQQLDSSMNINFAADNLSAVWNYFDAEKRCYSWLLRFEDKSKYDAFQTGFSRLMWETLNEEKWEKVKGVEQRYINEAYEEDVEMLESEDESEQQEQERVRRDDEEAEVAAELEEADGLHRN